MLKLTKTGIGLLMNQYRSVLRKCLLCNIGIFTILAINSNVLALDADNYFCRDAYSAYLCNIDRIQFNSTSE